jgi:Tol biopolymer transport system component
MTARFLFAVAMLVLLGCRDGALTGRRSLDAERQSAGAAPAPTTRRLWSGPGVDSLGSPSPDGRFLSFVDWNTGDLAVRELATGATRSIVKTRGDVSDFAYQSAFSPDGKRVAYGFFDGDQYDLRVVGIDGSAPRVVFRRTESVDVIPSAWSPDGTQILATVRWKDRTSQVALINPDTGAARMLKSFGWQYPSKLAFSPDGRYIAYDFARNENSLKRDIAILATDGSADTPVATHDANDRVLGWSPDGQVLFSSDRDGRPALWMVRVTDGRPAAPVPLEMDLWRLDHALGFAKNGAFYYSVTPTVADLYVATIDPASRKVITAPQPVVADDGDTHGPGAWSPDGRWLAYLATDQPVSVSFTRLVVRALETGEQRIFTPELASLRSVQWFADGRSLLVGGIDFKGRQGFYRVDAQSGMLDVLRLRAPDAPNMFGPSLSPDGATLYFRTSADPKGEIPLIVARDLRSGTEREVHRFTGTLGWPSASPDGTQVAVAVTDRATRRTSIVTVPAAGGKPRTILTLPEGYALAGNRGRIVWGSSGTLFFMPANAKQDAEAWIVQVDGSNATKLDLNLPVMVQPQLHPDGRRLLFRAGEVTEEIWALQLSASR